MTSAFFLFFLSLHLQHLSSFVSVGLSPSVWFCIVSELFDIFNETFELIIHANTDAAAVLLLFSST